MNLLKKTYLLALLGVLCLHTAVAWGQTTVNMNQARELFRDAQEMYEKQMYGLAQQTCTRLLDNKEALAAQAGWQWVAQIAYYHAACAYELGAVATEQYITAFMATYPQSERTNEARYLLAKYYFRQGNHDKASAVFQTILARALPEVDFPEYNFKYAYSLFVQQRFEEASSKFRQIKDNNSKYAPAATYYFSHIAYEQKNYSVALKGFESLRTDEVFSKLAPYYILHIYHSQHNYDKVIEEGGQFVESVKGKRLPEIARIVGEAYYFKKQYDKALPYIEKFVAAATSLTRSDRYLLGYIYYQNKLYDKATKLFEQIVVGSDSLAQMAYYYLADSWLHSDEKLNAGRAFQQASKMDFMPEIKEDALFNYAKLMFELNSGPFNDAIEALTQFIVAYPNSKRADEIHKYLMQAYVSSRNYKEALASLNAIKNPDADALAAMQKVTYYRALELFQNQQFQEAIALFGTSLNYASYSPRTAALATYWKGETYYRMENYSEAKSAYNEFLLSPSVAQTEEHKTAHYNLAYCFFKLGDYRSAQNWFRKFVAMEKHVSLMRCDAYNRLGDCNFKQHAYRDAIADYQKSIADNLIDVDYVTFQCGLCYGLVQNPDQKIALMNKVILYRPVSLYADNALFEKGRTYVQVQKYPQAIDAYEQLLQKKQSAFYSKTLVELGLIHVNQGKHDKAMNYYKQVMSDYSGTPESRSAMVGIRNIYVEQGNAEAYFDYAIKVSGGTNIAVGEKDSIFFATAEHAYFSKNDERAASLLKKYIADFPSGAFLMEVNFYLADVYYRTEKFEDALPYYEAVLKYPKNDYTEGALEVVAKLAFNTGKYEKAAMYYDQLIATSSSNAGLMAARLGKFRSDYLLKDYSVTIDDATTLLAMENLPKEWTREIYYTRAKCYENTENADKAMADFALVAADLKTKEGAEAKFKIIENYFKKGDLERAESEVLEFSKRGTTHQYWMAKAFILLGDIYVLRNDVFQAKATYESILGGYHNTTDGVTDQIKERMQQLLDREKVKEATAVESPYSVDL